MKIPSPLVRRKARIEIIPLIDIVFFLLATFVMVSLSMVKNQGIQVKLPQASTAAEVKEKTITVITVTKDSELFVGKDALRRDELPRFLKRLQANDPDPKIMISGDAKALFETAVSVLDEVRKAGIAKVSIQTTRKDEAL